MTVCGRVQLRGENARGPRVIAVGPRPRNSQQKTFFSSQAGRQDCVREGQRTVRRACASEGNRQGRPAGGPDLAECECGKCLPRQRWAQSHPAFYPPHTCPSSFSLSLSLTPPPSLPVTHHRNHRPIIRPNPLSHRTSPQQNGSLRAFLASKKENGGRQLTVRTCKSLFVWLYPLHQPQALDPSAHSYTFAHSILHTDTDHTRYPTPLLVQSSRPTLVRSVAC